MPSNRNALKKLRIWLILLPFLMMLILRILWFMSDLLYKATILPQEISAASLTRGEALIPENSVSEKLRRRDIVDIAKILNSPKQTTSEHPYNSDLIFTFQTEMKSGSQRHFRFFFTAKCKVCIEEMRPPYFVYPLRSWTLAPDSARKVFDLRFMQDFYSSAEPVFPLVYAHDKELIGAQSTDRWEYQNIFGEWHTARLKYPKQERHYYIESGILNILFPCFPEQKKYALYDEKDRLIERGTLASPQLYLPAGKYKLELTGRWNHEGGIKAEYEDYLHFFSGHSAMPNSFRGETTTVLHLHCAASSEGRQKAEPPKETILLLPLEDTMEKLGARYFIDRKYRRFVIRDFLPFEPMPVRAEEIRAEDIEKTETFDMTISKESQKRTLYFIGDKPYARADLLCSDLGLSLKKQEDSSYHLEENKAIYPFYSSDTYNYGYVDRKGEWVIPPLLETAKDFDGDHAFFSIHADILTDKIIGAKEEGKLFANFAETLAKNARRFDDMYVPGIFDKEGKVFVPPKISSSESAESSEDYNYYYGNSSSTLTYEGKDVAYSYAGSVLRYYFLSEGRQVEIDFGERQRISGVTGLGEGLITVKIDERYSYFDLDGRPRFNQTFLFALPFSGGRAVVRNRAPEDQEGKYAVIDMQGQFKTPYLFDDAEKYSEGLGLVSLKTRNITQYAYIDTEGNALTDLDYLFADSFRDGRALVNLDNLHLGYIDKNFKPVKNEKGEPIALMPELREGPAEQALDELSGSVYNFVFSEGIARVRQGDRYRYIDTLGNLIIAAEFPSAEPFKNGLARVTAEIPDTGYDGSPYFRDEEVYIDTFGRIIEVSYLEESE